LKPINYIFSIDKFFFKHLSYISDSSIFRHSESTEKFFRFITKFGEGYFELLLTIVLLSLFLSNKQKYNHLKKYILAIIFTLLSTQITVNIMKILFARARPSITINPEKFYGIMTLIKDSSFWKGSYVSFPSGHTITIWGTIWILSFIIKSKAIKIPLFILGILVGMSRIYLVRHWTTDVVASVILSYFIAKFVHKKMFENKERIRKTRLFSYDRKTNIRILKKDIITNTLNYKNKKIEI